jgi:O-antigen/teichoic acid export membrane protein
MLLFGTGGFMLLIRILPSKEVFGVWALFLTITTILGVLRNGLVRNGLVKHLASSEDPIERTEILGSSLMLNTLFTIVQSIIVVAIAQLLANFWDAPQLVEMFYWFIGASFFFIIVTHLEFVQQANFDFLGVFWSYVSRSASFFFYLLWCYVSSRVPSFTELTVVYLATWILGGLIGYIPSRKMQFFTTRFTRSWLKKLYDFGKYTFGTNLSSQAIRNTDQWMLGRMISAEGVAQYNPAIRIANLVEVPTLAVAQIVFPQAAKMSGTTNKSTMKDLYEKSVASILCFVIPALVVLFIFAEETVVILAGERYADTKDILRITLFYSLFIPFARQFGVILDASGKQQINFYFVLLTGVLNVVFNYFFIQSNGVIGAAYGTLLTYVIGFGLNQWFLRKEFQINIGSVFKYIPSFYGMVVNKMIRR